MLVSVSRILGGSAERLEGGMSSPIIRETASSVYHVIEGRGFTEIDGTEIIGRRVTHSAYRLGPLIGTTPRVLSPCTYIALMTSRCLKHWAFTVHKVRIRNLWCRIKYAQRF